MTNKKGFTLIELLVVIAIIGILSAIGLVSLNGAREKARDAKRITDLNEIRTAMIIYFDDHGSKYFATSSGGAVDASGGDGGFKTAMLPYLPNLPQNPGTGSENNHYFYASNGVSYGLATKMEGGTGDWYILNSVGWGGTVPDSNTWTKDLGDGATAINCGDGYGEGSDFDICASPPVPH